MTDTNGGVETGMQVDADLVRRLAQLLNENDLSEIEVEDGARRIKVKRQLTMASAPAAAPAQPASTAHVASQAAPPPAEDVAAANHPGAVKSPMVGTAYLSGEPGAAPFVATGTKVSAGDTLLIVEAMKVMNPITAPRSGTVTQVLVQDGQPVEYDQPLVILE